jgi:hypothetical protein
MLHFLTSWQLQWAFAMVALALAFLIEPAVSVDGVDLASSE